MNQATNDLFNAIRRNDLVACQLAIDQNANLNISDNNDCFPLDWAFYCKHKDVAKLLIQHGAKHHNRTLFLDNLKLDRDLIFRFIKYGMDLESIESGWRRPLISDLILYRFDDLIELVLKKGANPNTLSGILDSPLLFAISERKLNIVKLLVNYGANINICNRNDGTTSLIIALEKCQNDIEIIEFLLKNGADPNIADKDGYYPLSYVSGVDAEKISKLLVSYGANIDNLLINYNRSFYKALVYDNYYIAELLLKINNADLYRKDQDGDTILHSMSRWSSVSNSIKMILEYGFNPNLENNDMKTPLHIAAKNWKIGNCELLLKHGAFINAIDKHGNTPLHLAIDKMSITKLLLDHGANPDIMNSNGKSPLHYAIEKKNYELISLFQKARKNQRKNIAVLIQAHEFDEQSLLYRDYLCRDLFKILIALL